MGQQPRIEPDPADLPRQSPQPAPPRRWQANRPGDPTNPQEVPWGGAFGTPGPDSGYGLKLVKALDFPLEPGEQRASVESAVVALIIARASLFGRAPTTEDRDAALLLLGLGVADEVPAQHRQALIAARRYWAPRAATDAGKARTMVARIPTALLASSPEEIRHLLAMGENPLDPG